jgi:hypothetical protein
MVSRSIDKRGGSEVKPGQVIKAKVKIREVVGDRIFLESNPSDQNVWVDRKDCEPIEHWCFEHCNTCDPLIAVMSVFACGIAFAIGVSFGVLLSTWGSI